MQITPKARLISLIIAIVFMAGALIGSGIYLIINHLNKVNATIETTLSINKNLYGTDGKLDPDAVAEFLEKLDFVTSGGTYTSPEIADNAGVNVTNSFIFPMGYVVSNTGEMTSRPIYWQAVYASNGCLTILMTQNYTVGNFNENTTNITSSESPYIDYTTRPSDYGNLSNYSYSMLRDSTLNIYNFLADKLDSFSEIIKTPTEANATWQTNQNEDVYAHTRSSSSTVGGISGRYYVAHHNNLDSYEGNYIGWGSVTGSTWRSCMDDKFWIPSYTELYNSQSYTYSTNDTWVPFYDGGIWGLSVNDLAFDILRLDTNTYTLDYTNGYSNHFWLRSGFSNTSYSALLVNNEGATSSYGVNGSFGVRPAAHLSLSALASSITPTIIMETSGYPSLIGGLAGGFEYTGWEGVYDNTHVRSGNYSLKITANTAVAEVNVPTANVLPIDTNTRNHVYYFQYWGYQDVQTAGNTQIYWPIEEPSMGKIPLGPAGQWNMYSYYGTRADNALTGPQQVRIDFDNGYQAGEIWFDDFLMLDLTEIFGAGNEPSKEWCDANIVSGTNVQTFESSTNVVLENRPGADAQLYEFKGWSTIPKTTSDTTQPIVYGNGAIINDFVGVMKLYGVWDYKVCTVDISTNINGGTISGGGDYLYGSMVTLTATTKIGYEFLGWDINGDGAVDETSNSYVFTATDDITITAIYEQLIKITICSNNAGYGQILINGTLQEFIPNYELSSFETTDLYAITKPGYAFLYWLDQATGQTYTNNPLNYTVSQSTILIAVFSSGLLDDVAVVSTYGGSAEILGDDFETAEQITLIARLKINGYQFIGWYVGNSETPISTEMTVTLNYDDVQGQLITARFAPIDNSSINNDIDNGYIDDFM